MSDGFTEPPVVADGFVADPDYSLGVAVTEDGTGTLGLVLPDGDGGTTAYSFSPEAFLELVAAMAGVASKVMVYSPLMTQPIAADAAERFRAAARAAESATDGDGEPDGG